MEIVSSLRLQLPPGSVRNKLRRAFMFRRIVRDLQTPKSRYLVFEVSGSKIPYLFCFFLGIEASNTECLDPHGLSPSMINPRGPRYQILKDFGPKSHNHHGLEAFIP